MDGRAIIKKTQGQTTAIEVRSVWGQPCKRSQTPQDANKTSSRRPQGLQDRLKTLKMTQNVFFVRLPHFERVAQGAPKSALVECTRAFPTQGQTAAADNCPRL